MCRALIEGFQRAGVPLEILKEPIRKIGDTSIVQIDIHRKVGGSTRSRSEVVRIWPGHPDNIVQVRDVDRRLQQLVLLVNEPVREFEEAVSEQDINHFKRLHGTDWKKRLAQDITARNNIKLNDISFRPDGSVVIKNKTTGRSMYYLVGLDERQYFIATLPTHCTTVAEAHRDLKTTTVTLAEGRVHGRTTRQGEWFFLPCTEGELTMIKEGIGKTKFGIHKRRAIGPGGKPHIADELVEFTPSLLGHGFPVRNRPEVFVRGKVRHPDHATVSFSQWKRVIRNNEPASGPTQSRPNGLFWVD